MDSGSDRERDKKLESQVAKMRSKMGKDLRTVKDIEEKVKNISKRMSKPSKSSWKQIKPKKTVVELRNMESQLGGIYRRFQLLVSSHETVNVDELRHKINLINGLKPKITQLVEALNTSSVDDIGQSSQQFESLEVNPTPTPCPNPNPNPNPFHEGHDLRFPSMYPPDPDSICIPPAVHIAEDDNSLIADMYRTFCEMVKRRRSQPEPTFLDGRELCEDALCHLKSTKGADYDFVGFASILVPVFFSTTFGDGFHLNFFARPKDAPSHSPAHLIFVEVANGSPQKIIRCVPLPEIPYSHGDEDKPSSHTVYHPDNEDCPYCEHAKDGSLSRNFCLPPPMM